MMAQLKFDEVIVLNGQKLDKHYIQSLSKEERLDLIDPIFSILRKNGFIYPDNFEKLRKSWQRLLDHEIDINNNQLFNNSSLATDICKHFCHSFYTTNEGDKPTIIDNFLDDDKLKKMVYNRLGLEWLEHDGKGPGVNEAFNLSFKMVVIQAQRSMRMVNATSIFKPDIAKYVCTKYSNPGDIVGDYSCGFGARLMGAMACGRKYIGTDPLTTPELETMAKFFDFKDYKLIKLGSEYYRGEKNSVDLYWSSPPYFDQEVYSKDISQAYNQGEEHFYNIYWKKTLENIKYMLKPGKWFGLNVLNQPKMLEMAQEYFGDIKEAVDLKTTRSHLTKEAGIIKVENIYMFLNKK